jgi:hypothetical protein
MKFIKMAARVALLVNESGLIMIHMNTDLSKYPNLDPNGTSAHAFSQVVNSLGGEVLSWEDDWLDIDVPRLNLDKMLNHLKDIEAGKHGPEAQEIAQAYKVTELYDPLTGDPITTP